MKAIISIVVLVVFSVCLPAIVYGSTYTYTTGEFQSARSPFGRETTSMSISSPGDIVRIIGTGFGSRDLNDGIPEMVYVANPTVGNKLWDIDRSMYDSGGPKYFGLMSWTDNEIELEVKKGFGSLLGSFIQLRTYDNPSDNQGRSIRGAMTISTVPLPPSLWMFISGIAMLFFRRCKNNR